MRVVTWNINGVRTLPQYHPWNTFKTFDEMLNHLDADIVCFQEMKSSRQILPKAVALPPSFDSFFSFPLRKNGYSGTAIYTRRTCAVPLKAEEGLTGHLQPKPPLSHEERVSRVGNYPPDIAVNAVNEAGEGEGSGDGGVVDYKLLDSEGRAVVLDLGLFVLINTYCPNDGTGTEERDRFKMAFHRLLEARVRSLIAEGREVMLVGDINACAGVEDHCEGEIMVQRGLAEGLEGEEGFWGKESRRWMRDLLVSENGEGKGKLVDIVRKFWPDRKGMYTCWNTKISARDTNYGTRIDFILITPGLVPWIKAADIQPQIKGSDHCPVFVDFHDEISIPATTNDNTANNGNKGSSSTATAKTIKLSDVLGACPSPDTGEPADPPRMAAKHWDEHKQKLLSTFFGKKAASDSAGGGASGSKTGAFASPKPLFRLKSRGSDADAGPSASPSKSKVQPKENAKGKAKPTTPTVLQTQKAHSEFASVSTPMPDSATVDMAMVVDPPPEDIAPKSHGEGAAEIQADAAMLIDASQADSQAQTQVETRPYSQTRGQTRTQDDFQTQMQSQSQSEKPNPPPLVSQPSASSSSSSISPSASSSSSTALTPDSTNPNTSHPQSKIKPAEIQPMSKRKRDLAAIAVPAKKVKLSKLSSSFKATKEGGQEKDKGEQKKGQGKEMEKEKEKGTNEEMSKGKENVEEAEDKESKEGSSSKSQGKGKAPAKSPPRLKSKSTSGSGNGSSSSTSTLKSAASSGGSESPFSGCSPMDVDVDTAIAVDEDPDYLLALQLSQSEDNLMPEPSSSQQNQSQGSSSQSVPRPVQKDTPKNNIQPKLREKGKGKETENKQDTKQAWATLLAPTQAPLCFVHCEPAKESTVVKPGPNKGRRFFACSRSVGPGYDKGYSERRRDEVNPQYKCNFFMWSSDVRKEMARKAKSNSNGNASTS